MYLFACVAVFIVAYLLNILTVTVGYHRALAHRALTLHPALERVLVSAGPWLTGLDPKGWIVMHRLHHEHSDTPEDPHSPVNVGMLGIAMEQLRSYKRVIDRPAEEEPEVHASTRRTSTSTSTRSPGAGAGTCPTSSTARSAVALALAVGPLLGAAYFFGVMSHPVQGGLVNSLGHAVGGRNFDTDDNSRNNHLAAWLIFGEGFQNNHHQYPGSPSFSYRRSEIDLGYLSCKAMEKVGLLKIHRHALIPRPPRRGEVEAPVQG